MIKPRSAITRIGVGLAIAAGLSLGVPAASFAQEEFDTSQVSSITQNADTGITTCTNNADRAFSFQCAGTSATGYRQRMIPHRSIWISKVIREIRFGYIQTVRITQAVAAA